MSLGKRVIAALLIVMWVHPTLAFAAESSEEDDVNVEWHATPPDVMIWYGSASERPPLAGKLSLLGRDSDAAFLQPGTYQFWASLSELEEPHALQTPVLINSDELTTISVEWDDHPNLRLWGFGVGLTGLIGFSAGGTMLAQAEDKTIPTGMMIGGGGVLALGVLLIAISFWASDGFKATISSRQQHRAEP